MLPFWAVVVVTPIPGAGRAAAAAAAFSAASRWRKINTNASTRPSSNRLQKKSHAIRCRGRAGGAI